MDLERLFKLRREVRRNDDISDAASRLFCEIVDLHQLQEGCVATLAKIADYLGKSPRTISRRRDELMEAGYLRTEQRAKCRALVPKWPDEPDEQGQTVPDRFDERPDKSDEAPDTDDGSAPDKFDEHIEIDIPAEPQESARVREGGMEDSRFEQDPIEQGPDEQDPREDGSLIRENDPSGVEVWIDVTGERPTIQTRENLKNAFIREDGPRWNVPVFRKTLREAFQNVDRDPRRIKIGYLMSSYEKKLSRGDSVPRADQVHVRPSSAQETRSDGDHVYSKPTNGKAATR
jgi:hypothetical protein